MSFRIDALQSVLAAPPNLDTAVVADAVVEQFGLSGDYAPLVSERDQNFRVTRSDGTRFVVKVTSLVEDVAVTDFQIAVLLHLENHGLPGVPRIVRTRSGQGRGTVCGADGVEFYLRVVTWLRGRLLRDGEITPEIAGRIGQRLAGLDMALLGFAHPGDSQVLLWDTERAGDLCSLTHHIGDAVIRGQVDAVLQDFVERVKPNLLTLPRQVIHNDANNENILLDTDDAVSGIIDFGDMLRAARIIEVSTAASYLRSAGDDPLQVIASLVVGYHVTSPLTESEIDALFDLIRIRLVMTMAILHWRLAAREDDDLYRQKTIDGESDASDFLRRMSTLGCDAFHDRIHAEIEAKTTS